ncbi:MAG: potassium channel family protein [Billgrantia sp.]
MRPGGVYETRGDSGYGDVTPITALGKLFAGITAVAGIGLIAMPTGILAAAFSDAFQKKDAPEE